MKQKQFDRLLSYITRSVAKDNIKIEFADTKCLGFFDADAKLIQISDNISIREKASVIIHEWGHFLIFKKYNRYARKIDDTMYKNRSIVSKVYMISDEIKAWDVGVKRARKICPRFVISWWFKNYRARALWSHIKFLAG